MKQRILQTGLLVILILAISVSAAGAQSDQALAIPEFTETDCVWDEQGNLVSETAHGPNGEPALNSRGFARASYTWDEYSNLLTEAYFGLNGEPVTANGGYARAEYTYVRQADGRSYVLTEDRYAPDGSRAQIPGSYSYRRDVWQDDQILSSEYFDANGALTRPVGGYARILYDVEIGPDADTKTVTKRYLDADGSLLLGTEGGATVIFVYTANTGKPLDEETVLRDPAGVRKAVRRKPDQSGARQERGRRCLPGYRQYPERRLL